jgi:hypothetical protein
MFFLFVLASAASAFVSPTPAYAGTRVDCAYHAEDPSCAYLYSGQWRLNRRHSETCDHFPFSRLGRAGPIEIFALDFLFKLPPRNWKPEWKRAFIKEQTDRHYFKDHKIAGSEDDFCEEPWKIKRPVSVVICDEFGVGVIRGYELEYTLRYRHPPDGARIPLYYTYTAGYKSPQAPTAPPTHRPPYRPPVPPKPFVGV